MHPKPNPTDEVSFGLTLNLQIVPEDSLFSQH